MPLIFDHLFLILDIAAGCVLGFAIHQYIFEYLDDDDDPDGFQ